MKKILFLIPLLFITLLCFAPNSKGVRSMRVASIEVGPIEVLYFDGPDYKLKSFQFIESSYREKVIGDHGTGYGILQFHQERIDDINDIVGWKKYTLEDALDAKIATEMWYVYQNAENPTYNLKKACLLHNGYAKDKNLRKKYYNKIKTKYKKLCQEGQLKS